MEDNKDQTDECPKIKTPAGLPGQHKKHRLGKETAQKQLYAPLLEVPDADGGDKLGRDEKSVYRWDKNTQFFHTRGKDLGKTDENAQVRKHTEDGYGTWTNH